MAQALFNRLPEVVVFKIWGFSALEYFNTMSLVCRAWRTGAQS
jgi:hypothetical protein